VKKYFMDCFVSTNEANEGFGDIKIGGQIICTVKYADVLVLLTEEETVLQGMIDIEVVMEKSKVMRISRGPSTVQIVVSQK
jgi:hypothetical protein